MDDTDVLPHVTGEWQVATVISMNVGTRTHKVVKILQDLECRGIVESMFDGSIFVRYWRLKQKGFRPASELKKEFS